MRTGWRSSGGVSIVLSSRMPGERHLERARDRRGGHREHVDVRPHLLQPLLVRDAEALLLVDDQQAEVREAHIAAEQPVRADHDVDLARRDVGDHDLLLVGVDEPREHLDRHRERREPFAERQEVLLGEQRRRHEHRRPACRSSPP